MALAAGTVSVDSAGVATGSGLALAIYNGKVTAHTSAFGSAPDLANKRFHAAMAAQEASAIVTYFAANADVRVPQNGLDTGVPTVERVLAGALE